MANTAGLEVRESGRALRFHTETPHLVSTGSGRLSTTVTLHPLPEGRVVLGSSREADVQLAGTGVELVHCIIENAGGSVTLHPLGGGSTCVDGAPIAAPVRLTQGCTLTIGRSSHLRFNHPAEAKRLRSVTPTTPTTTTTTTTTSPDPGSGYHHGRREACCGLGGHPEPPPAPVPPSSEQRKPPAAPRARSPRDSAVGACSDDEVNFLGKLSKFETLARQARSNECVSPKVFPSGSLTTSITAEQLLGHSRSSSSLASLGGRSGTASPFQSLASTDRCPSADERNQSSLPIMTNRNFSPNQNAIYQNIGQSNKNAHHDLPPSIAQHQRHHHHHQQQQQQRQTCARVWQRNSPEYDSSGNDENRNRVLANGHSNDLMSRSLTCQRSCDLGQFSRDFDMSQSLIVAKTTTCTEFLQVEAFGSNPSLMACHRRAGSCDSKKTKTFASQPSIRFPSPAFDREPKFSDSRSLYGRIKGPSSSASTPVGLNDDGPPRGVGSLEELMGRTGEREPRRGRDNRTRGHRDLERQEKLRLEEILAMCAEYERQNGCSAEKPQQQQQRSSGPAPPRYTEDTPSSGGDCASTEISVDRRHSPEPPADVYGDSPSTRRQRRSQSPPDYENVFVHRPPAKPGSPTPNNKNNNNNNNGGCGDSRAGPPSIEWPEQQQQQQQPPQSPTNSNYEEIGPQRWQNGRTPGATDASLRGNDTPKSTRPPLPRKNGKLAAHNYENFVPINGYLSVYENVVSPPCHEKPNDNDGANNVNNNNAKNSSRLPRPIKRTTTREASETTIDNKLDVSNDDLLEAIEQLSRLAKARSSGRFSAASNKTTTTTTTTTRSNAATAALLGPTSTTLKRINSVRDSAKTNEAKAERERRELEEEDRKKYVEFLRNEKKHILGNMDGLKRSVADIERHEEEINRELELEKALLSAEYESESLKLEQEESEQSRLQIKIQELEDDMEEKSASQAQLQAEAKQRVLSAQQACARLEEELAEAKGRDDERDSDLADKLASQTELLETERKAFEDLEFHHLEEEASKLATREELQRYLGELLTKIESRKVQINQLEIQCSEIKNTVIKEAKSLERQKLTLLRRLEESRNRLRAIDDELESLAKNTTDNHDEKRSPSREDFDRISRVTTDSPIVNNQGSLGRKTIESLKEIERNRQLHLCKQGSQVISEERRRVEELKRRVQDEVRSQWEERKMNCTSFNSVESGEESSSYSTGPTESGSGSSDGAENGTGEKLSPGKLSEFTSPSPGPSSNSYTILQVNSVRDERPTPMETQRFNGNGSGIADETGSRPLSQTSSELDSLDPLQVKHRDKPKLQRPLTRYLPIKSESLDLRHHIETAGHQLPLIRDVTVNTTSCSGYLSKMSKKFHHWNKRWFVFDRKRKMLAYYSDNNSRKLRGVIYFQSIEEVYIDHMNTVKSPQPSLTFIVKTTTRLYHLMAPSPEAMRVWVDVVFTGAEGYHEFDPNL